MSLLRWRELAKRKSKLGDKINYTHDVITKHNIGQQATQKSLEKVFKPVTSKLDDVIESNLQIPKVPEKRVKKGMRGELEAPDYYPEVDPFEDMDVENIFEPQQQKQIPKEPPRYSEVFDTEGPDYATFTEEGEEEGEEDTDEDTEVEDESEDKITPEDFDLPSIVDVETELDKKKNKTTYLESIIAKATHERNRLKGFKSSNTKRYNAKKISFKEAHETNAQLDESRKVLTAYINENKKLLKTLQQKGSGIRRKHRGENVMFFNDVKQLLKKLELIIGEVLAGNTSIQMRNMGVAILDTLLKRSTINEQQYKQIYNLYFKV